MKKAIKSFMALILATVLVLGAAPLVGLSGIDFHWPDMFAVKTSAATSGIYYYEVTSGNVTIIDCIEPVSGEITIPSTLDGYPVMSIGDRAFAGCSGLTSITIPNSVTSIGDNQVFAGCSGLLNIWVNSGNAVYSSANGVLMNKNQTMLIACPGGKSGDYTIPAGVTSIEDGAFFDCENLTSITIPNSVTSIGEATFACCFGLLNIWVNPSNAVYSSANGVLVNKNQTMLIACPGGKSGDYTIPAGVTSIGDGAFVFCSRLACITIPNSVISIGEATFSGCFGLLNIWVNSGNAVYSSANGVLMNKNQTMLIACPGGKSGGYTVPAGVANIGNWAFYGCRSLTSIIIPNSVTKIGDNAFYDCGSLTSITIPVNVMSIGNGAFCGCRNLTSITIPSSVTRIGYNTFFDCESLTNVSIPAGVTSIGDNAFSECESLTSISIPAGVTSIGDNAFSVCTSLISITIPNSVTSIGDGAFVICGSLTIMCSAGSYAEKYAKEHDIPYRNPSKPINPKAVSASYNSIKITWTGVSGATGYIIYRSTVITGIYTKVGSVTGISYTDPSLTTGKSYFYKVFAYQAIRGTNIYSAASMVVSAKPIPATPSNFKAACYSSTSIRLTWSPVAGASGYVLYKYNALTKTYVRLKVLTASSVSYINTGLGKGVTYYYKVRAYRTVSGVNVYGNPSATASAKTY